MNHALVLLLTLFCTVGSWAKEQTYEFPTISDKYSKYAATVVGTLPPVKAELPEGNPLKMSRIRIFEDRVVPEVFFYEEEMRFSYAWQKQQAPLIFLIAGTGAAHNGAKNVEMAKAFFHAGFHVISLSSPTYMNFIVSASRTSVPGHAFDDAEDLYNAMEKIWHRYSDKVRVSDFYVTGYSLGGFNTGFVAKLDENRKVFNFRKALMINPPVSLYNSTSLLDRMSDNIPGGVDNFSIFYDRLLKEVSRVYRDAPSVEIDEEFLFKAFKAVDPNNEELAALVGVSFRMSSANLIYTADVMNQFGFVVPSNVTVTPNTSQSNYFKVAQQLGFTDYFHGFFYPYFKQQDPDKSREDFSDLMSLYTLEDYFRSSDKVEVMHNLDDIILETGEIEFFPRVFGDRAKIYPKGGHCGNMSHRDNVAHMINVFTQ